MTITAIADQFYPAHPAPRTDDTDPAAATVRTAGLIDRAGLRDAAHRIAGAAFCGDVRPVVISFARARVADHFAVADEVVDAMIATELLGLTDRLGRELVHVTRL